MDAQCIIYPEHMTIANDTTKDNRGASALPEMHQDLKSEIQPTHSFPGKLVNNKFYWGSMEKVVPKDNPLKW